MNIVNARTIKITAIIALTLFSALKNGPLANASDMMQSGDLQIHLITDPEEVISGQPVSIVAKLLRGADNRPVPHADVTMQIQQATEEIGTKEINKKAMYPSDAPTPLPKADGYGNYELLWVFDTHGDYRITLVIHANPSGNDTLPVTAAFTIKVYRPVDLGVRLKVVMGLMVILTMLVLYTLYWAGKSGRKKCQPFNLLRIPWISALFKWKYFQPIFQIPLILLTALIIWLAIWDVQDAGRNLASILFWTLWWAGIIFTFVVVGRMWCFMCPIGALSEWVARLFNPQRTLPPRMRNLWLANIAFVLLTWVDVQLGVVRHPVITGYLLIGITGLALVIGALYQRRTFCRYLCPIGGLIGVYSMFSAVELRVQDPSVCKCHKTKECYQGSPRGYGCPMFEFPPKMNHNTVCNFCGECIKTCSKQNLSLHFRPFFQDAWGTRADHMDEAALSVVLVGVTIFVTGDMLEPWQRWITAATQWLALDRIGIHYAYVQAAITKSLLYVLISLVIIPGTIWLAALMADRNVTTKYRKGSRNTFIAFGYMFIPIGLAMHLAHNIGHLLNESAALLPALKSVINRYTPIKWGTPDWQAAAEPLAHPSTVYMLQMGLIVVFYMFSIYAGYRIAQRRFQDPSEAYKALLPMAILASVFTFINLYLLNLPMALRHVH